MKNKSIWLINQYLCTPQLNGDGHRHSFLAEEFIKKGYDVTLITSSFSHVPYRENKIKGLFQLREEKIRTLLIKGNTYKNTQGMARVSSWLIFCLLLFFIPIRKLPKPDIIIVSSNSLLPILNVVFYFKKKFKTVKFILEIRDIWPLSLVELGGFSPKNPVICFLAWVEKMGYKHAHHIVSLLMDADKHIKQVLKDRPFHYTWISNGYQVQKEDYYEPLPDTMLKRFPEDKFIVGYAGSLGKANAMETIIKAIKNNNENSCLCIIGEGDDKKNLLKLANNSDNVLFFDKVPKNKVLSFLSRCDVLYFSSKNLPIYQYGISANKTFDYMYAAKPILLSAPTKNNVIEWAACGTVIEPENEDMLLKELLKFKNMTPEERKQVGENGKKYLLNHYTYQKLAQKFIHIFNTI